MKLLFTVIGLSFFITLAQGQQTQTSAQQQFDGLSWVLGQWQRTNERQGAQTYETWEKESDSVYRGLGVTIKGGDTTFVEKLRIELKDNKLYYVAEPQQNTKPTYFEMTTIEPDGFVSENPEHDFPKMIQYIMKEGTLTAIISDGGDKKIGFVFKKD